MSIKNRLKKLESEIKGTEESEFCECYEKYWQSEAEAAYNENPDVKIEVFPKPDFTKDSCNGCGKAFSKKDVDMNKKVEQIYG